MKTLRDIRDILVAIGYECKLMVDATGNALSVEVYCDSILRNQHVEFIRYLLAGTGYTPQFIDNKDYIEVK